MELLPQLILNGLVNGSHYALLGLGFGLIFGTTNLVHFAYGPIYTSAAYAAWAAAAMLGLPLVLAVPFGIAACTAIGVLTYLALYRPFERHGAPTFVILVASLGFFILLENVIAILFGTDIKVIPDLPSHVVLVGDLFLTDIQIAQMAALVVVGGALALFLNFTSYGKAIMAMADNPEMARVIGIDTVRVTVAVFAIGSAISAVPAVLILMKDGAQPIMGFSAVFLAFVAVVVGGIGSLRGAVLGGYLLGLVENLGMISIPTEWQSTIAFVVLFLVLVFRPQGLFRGA